MVQSFIFLSLAGALAGIINGLFGTGAGIVVAACQMRLGAKVQESLAAANFAVLVLSLVSFFVYFKSGSVSRQTLVSFVLPRIFPALVGGGLGALVCDKISSRMLSRLFALLIFFCGVRMLFS